MMLGPPDIPNSGALEVRSVLDSLISNAPGGAMDKNRAFEMANAQLWPSMMAPVLADLPSALAVHFNYTLMPAVVAALRPYVAMS